MNILMLCYYYPPLIDVGCKRSVAFSKYFKKQGWNPHVVSVKNPDAGYCSIGTDKPPAGVHVEYTYSVLNLYTALGKVNAVISRLLRLAGIKTRGNFLYDLFCIPDIFWGWIPLSLIRSLRIMAEKRIDFIYVSCTPFSSALLGTLLKWITRKPLVIDFRDAIALESIGIMLGTPRWRRQLDQWFEKTLLSYADLFVVTTDEIREAYISQYPQTKDRIFTIYNGVDSEILSQVSPAKYEKFTIVYTGEFYFYSPAYIDAFFNALLLLKMENGVASSNFQFLFYGDGREQIYSRAKEFGVEDLVSAHGRIPHVEIIAVIARSHLQLLRIVRPMISTKLFEGIPLNVPFLATVQEGEVVQILREFSPASVVVSEDRGESIRAAILEIMGKYRMNEVEDNRTTAFLDIFSRERLTLRLMDIIETRLGSCRT